MRQGQVRLKWQLAMLLMLFLIAAAFITGDSGKVLAYEPGDKCAVTPSMVDGQGLNVASFGLSVTPFGLNVSQLGLNVSGFGLSVSQFGLNVSQFGSPEDIISDIVNNLVTPQWLLDLLPGIQGGSGFNSEQTVLLIVDDFSFPGSHGDEVRQVVDDLVAALADAGLDANVDIIPVDISDDDPALTYAAEAIAQKIRDAVNAIETGEGQVKKVVINMSFGLIPCDDPVGIITDSETGQTFDAPAFHFEDFLNAMNAAQNPTKAVIPILECVERISNGNFNAYFGYDNKNSVEVEIPIGNNNQFNPDPQDRGQPTVFGPGRHSFVFKQNFDGSERVWKIIGPDGKVNTSTANAQSRPRCGTIPPMSDTQIVPLGYGLTRYLLDLGVPENFIDDYLEYLFGQGDEDPLRGLRALLQEYMAASDSENQTMQVIPVGATGNFAHLLGPDALAPANYPEVIGTGATLGDYGDKWVLSHNGDVLAPGAGYPFAYDADGKLASVGAGTSFAAPYMSLYSALWLTYPNACIFDGEHPPLIDPILNFDPTKSANYSAKNNNPFKPLNCSRPPQIDFTYGEDNSLTINEGAAPVVVGTVSDPDGDTVTLSVNVAGGTATNNGDGTWSFTHDDGPLGPVLVTVTADDGSGGTDTASFMLTVNNVAPTATFSASPTTINQGGSVAASFTNPHDPSSADTAAGFWYSYDCASDGTYEIEDSLSPTHNCAYPSAGTFTIKGRIADKDDGFTEYTAGPITVNTGSGGGGEGEGPQGFCVVTSEILDGQGLNVASFGLSVTPFGLSVSQLGLNVSGFGLSVSQFGLSVSQFGELLEDMLDNLVTPAWLTDQLVYIDAGAGSGFNSAKVYVLIVDDFSGDHTHGAQVRKVADDLYAALAQEMDPDPMIEIVEIDISDPDPTQTYQTEAIAQKIREKVQQLAAQGGVAKVVINMSFGLLPCEDDGGGIYPPFSFGDFLDKQEEAENPMNAVKPILECVVQHSNGNFTAYYGYDNQNTGPVEIPIGVNNHFNPDPMDRGQPTLFAPGRHYFVFSQDFDGSQRVWKLTGPNGKTYNSNANAETRPRCNGTPTVEDVQIVQTGYGITDYLTDVLGIPADQVDDYLQYLASKATELDANGDPLGLRKLTNDYMIDSANPTKNLQVIPVASSGNFAFLFGPAALAPANYPGVVATGATLGDYGPLWGYYENGTLVLPFSHNGDVLAPGAGYVFAVDAEDKPLEVGAGTSFAAPYMSMHAALWLTYPNACTFDLTPVSPETFYYAPLIQDVIAGMKAKNYAAADHDPFAPLDCAHPPVIEMNNSYVEINEGGIAMNVGTASDPNGGPVTLSASIVGSTGGQVINNFNGTWSYTHTDGAVGPSFVTITASNARGGKSTATFTLKVKNVAPTATFANTSGDALAGGTARFGFSNAFDPSPADTTAGFRYSVDCTNDGSFEVANSTAATISCTYNSAGNYTARGRIMDKDGSYTDYTAAVKVLQTSVCYAQSVGRYVPGKTNGGAALSADVTDTSKALGAPQKNDTLNYVSLGFGDKQNTGVLILDFGPNYIQNKAGEDLRIWETTYKDGSKPWSNSPEAVRVEVSEDGVNWYVLGITSAKDQAYNLDNAADAFGSIIPLKQVRYIKLVDITNSASFNRNEDGFDIDAVEGFSCTNGPFN